jgi:hypothetical protein
MRTCERSTPGETLPALCRRGATALAIGIALILGFLVSAAGAAGTGSALPAKTGPGTMAVSPGSVGTATSGNDLDFTFTSPSSGFQNGEVVVTVPRSWTAPQTETPTGAGYVSSGSGTVATSGRKILIENLSLCDGCSVTLSYEDAEAPARKGHSTFSTKSSADLFATKLAKLAVSPIVTVSKTAIPGAPTNVTVTPGDNSAGLSWTAPVADGNEPVMSYEVDGNGESVGGTSGATQTTIDDLTNGTDYAFTVAACNSVGCGPVSSPPETTVPYGAAGPPALSGSVSGGSISWTWSDTTDNGSPITGYDIYLDGSQVASDSSSTSFSQSFEFNTSHTLTVDADNAAGPGQQASDSETTAPSTLDADATPAFGTCPSNPPPFDERYCGGNSNACPTDAFSPSACSTFVGQGTSISALCWTTGQTIYNNYSGAAPGPNYTLSSNIWIEVANYPSTPWMNQLWFNPDNTAQDNLPSC